MITPFSKLYSYYEKNLTFRKIIYSSFSRGQKIKVATLMILFIGLCFSGTIDIELRARICLFLLWAASYVGIYLLLDRYSNEVLDQLVPKRYATESFNDRYLRFVTRKIIKFNRKKLGLKKRDLVELGNTARMLYGQNITTMSFPWQLIFFILTAAALVPGFLKIEEAMPAGDRFSILMGITIMVLIISMLYFVGKYPIEAFINSGKERAKRLSEILIGIRYFEK